MQRLNRQCLSAALAAACAFAAVMLASHSAGASATPGQACSAVKIRAAAKRANVQLGCYARAMLQGAPVDQNCLARAEAALVRTFQRAELKGGCATVNDTAAIGNTVGSFVSVIAGALPGALPPTRTPTNTPRPTATASPSATITQTQTPTSIPSPSTGGTPGTATPSATVIETQTPTSVQSPSTGTITPTPAGTTPSVTQTPTLTPTPGSNDCCQADASCGPPTGGACPGAVPVFNASCSGSSGQCVTFTAAPTNTATPTSPTPTETPVPTATNTPP